MTQSRSSSLVLGVDVGGTKTAAGLVEFPSGRPLTRRAIPTLPERGGRPLIDDILKLGGGLIAELSIEPARVVAVGVGVCELVGLDGNVLSANCVHWLDLPVREVLGRIAPVTLDADVRAAAMAEAAFGAGRPFRNFLYITVGTGISCCLMLDGSPYLGARGIPGTMASSPLGVPCDSCGVSGTQNLEDIASGPALVSCYRRTGGRADSAQDVLVAADGGDSSASEVIQSAADALGAQAALVVNTLDPEALIVGGGLGLAGGTFWERFTNSTRRHIWSPMLRDLPILPAGTGVDAGWIGAAAMAWRKTGGTFSTDSGR